MRVQSKHSDAQRSDGASKLNLATAIDATTTTRQRVSASTPRRFGDSLSKEEK
uniref:Uncharacterized protein n=1 Tax=Rhizophora mucronata TaxID=61149 RepID=A0A2P2K930_RHIMU